MRKLRAVFIFYIIAGLVVPGILLAQGTTNLSQTSDMSEYPFIIIRPNGNVMAVWGDFGHYNGGSSLWYRIWAEGNGWSTMKKISDSTSAFPQLALDSNGDVHMCYWAGGGGNRDIWYRKYSNGNWSAAQRVYESVGVSSAWNRIDVNGNTISVLWNHCYARPSPADTVYLEKINGGSWPAQYTNVSKTTKSLSIHCNLDVKNHNVHAVWMDDVHRTNNWGIYYASRINGHWSGRERVQAGANQYLPAVAADNSGNVHLIYTGKNGPTYYQKRSGGKWSSPKVISTVGTSSTTFNYMKFAGGLLHAVWRQKVGDSNCIYYATGTVNGSWEDPIRVSYGPDAEHPILDLDKKGRVHIVYSDRGVGGERDVYHARLDSVLTHPVASFTATPVSGDPPLYVSFNGSDSFDPDGSLISYSWRFGDGATGSGRTTTHIYTKKGTHTATLTVMDNEENTSTSSMEIMVGNPPIAVFSASPNSGAPPLKVEFDASESSDPDGNISTYHWDFGDNTTGAGKTTSHTYTKNNTVNTVTLTVTDDEGLQATASAEISLSQSAIAKFKYSPKQGQAPLKVSFNASTSKPSDKQNGSIKSYEWAFGDGKSGSGKTASHTYSKFGVYTVTLKITDNQENVASTTSEVTIYSKPVASFTSSHTSGIAPLKVNFNASASSDKDGTIEVYKWTFGDGAVGYGKTISHTYTKGGSFTINLTVTDNDSWSDTTNKSLTVIEKPYPPIKMVIKKIVNEGLYFADYINILEWKKNQKNTGKIKVVKYLVFKKKKNTGGSFIYIGETDSNTFTFQDLNITSEADMKSYIYGLRAVDAYGRESDMRTKDAGIN